MGNAIITVILQFSLRGYKYWYVSLPILIANSVLFSQETSVIDLVQTELVIGLPMLLELVRADRLRDPNQENKMPCLRSLLNCGVVMSSVIIPAFVQQPFFVSLLILMWPMPYFHDPEAVWLHFSATMFAITHYKDPVVNMEKVGWMIGNFFFCICIGFLVIAHKECRE